VERAEFFGQLTANLSRDRGILQKQGALKKFPAVQAGAKDEVTTEQGSGLFEKCENVGHGKRGFG
jgi:hypothetical protein